jgi:hypothetical protein
VKLLEVGAQAIAKLPAERFALARIAKSEATRKGSSEVSDCAGFF